MEIQGKRVLLTGGCGFIGSHLAKRFIEEGVSELIIYDNISTGFRQYIDELDGNIKIIEGNILDRDLLMKSMKDVDLVSHHAAELEVFNGIENVLHECEVNTIGTINVLTAALKNNVKKVIYASSGGVYGQASYLPEDENHPLMPHWPYGVSKLAGEKYCTQFTQLFGLPTVSFRYGIVFGPHEWFGRVLTMFIKRALEGKPPIIFGDGLQKRDFVYVEDVVEANFLGIFNDDVNGMAFNVGGVSHVNVKEIADVVINTIDPDLKPIYDDPKPGEASKYQPERKRLPGELRDFILDNKLIHEKLGYTPKVSLKEGVKIEVDWIKNNLSFWDYAPRV
ncbi:MAG: NAD-dependent epimerase/dehydratase family protein [Promethearchaeota archaeon]